jgi:hypothetical protein
MSRITMELETITPKTASEYLALNLSNRTLQSSTLNLYTRLMAQGGWMVNGDAIRFNTEGKLSDGQHRLQACVESGIPLTTYVVRGLPVEAQLTIDQQRKRTAGDMLHMRGIINGNRLASIVRMVHRWDLGERSMFGFSGGQVMLSAKEVVDLIDKDSSGLFLEASRRTSAHGLIHMAPPRVTGAMFVLFERADPALAQEFFDHLVSGAGLSEGDPILALRRFWINLASNSRRATSPAVYLMVGVRAWNAYAAGRKLYKMSYKNTAIPEIAIPDQKVVFDSNEDDSPDSPEALMTEQASVG